MHNLLYAFNAVAPVFLLVFIGYVLRRANIISSNYTKTSSKLVFSVSLPALIFIKLHDTDFTGSFDLIQITLVIAGFISFFFLTWLLSRKLTDDGIDQGVFIQGAVRSNYAIVGFAITLNLFSESALVKAAILLAFAMPLFNVLGVIALTVPAQSGNRISAWKTIRDILTNPLIIAIIISLIFPFFKINVPVVFTKTLNYLAVLSLPVALLGIGASFNFKSIRKDFKLTAIATVIRILIMPLILTYIAILLGYRGEELGVMFILFGTPTAIASYIMAEAMASNSELAGNIILVTTFGSVFTISLGIFALKCMALI